jgi:hypothetical protein
MSTQQLTEPVKIEQAPWRAIGAGYLTNMSNPRK